MVNVGAKPVQRRRAVAVGTLVCQPATIRALKRKALPKGDVLTVAQIAGIQAAKRTAELIPLCHPLALCHVAVSFRVRRDGDRDRVRGGDRGADRRGDGGADRRQRGGADALRHVQGRGQNDAHRGRARGGEDETMKIGRLTVSDRASAGVYEDRSGPEIERAAARSVRRDGGVRGRHRARRSGSDCGEAARVGRRSCTAI